MWLMKVSCPAACTVGSRHSCNLVIEMLQRLGTLRDVKAGRYKFAASLAHCGSLGRTGEDLGYSLRQRVNLSFLNLIACDSVRNPFVRAAHGRSYHRHTGRLCFEENQPEALRIA